MKDFVTFEIAEKLKEKGFKEKCVAYYWEKIDEHTPSFVVKDNMPEDGISLLDLLSNHNQAEWSPFVDAPTISQVLDWLRTNHGIHVRVDLWKKGWYFDVISYEYDESCGEYDVATKHQSEDYKSYDEAAIMGIKYVLDNLI